LGKGPVLATGAATNAKAAFRDDYARFVTVAREGTAAVSEMTVQALWYDQEFSSDSLVSTEGQALRVLSPGWWNRSEGPDFRGAQIQFGDAVRSGDVEIHLDHAAWRQHGHHLDPRYDQVMLVVVLDAKPPSSLPRTSKDRPIPCLLIGNYIDAEALRVSGAGERGAYADEPALGLGYCAEIAKTHGVDRIREFVVQAAESRMLGKSRAIRERAERVGMNQSVYESFMAACGYARFKHEFRTIAQQLPYERVVQLARQDPNLVETAFFQLAGLFPDSDESEVQNAHLARLLRLRVDQLAGMRSMGFSWKRVGVRPNNYPERRLSGAARFISRTSRQGLWMTLESVWRADVGEIERRRLFEALFPGAIGFWAEHCTWGGPRLSKPSSAFGSGRLRAIIGNVFLPAGLAYARQQRDREMEERVFALFRALPKEPENRIVAAMLPRVFGDVLPAKVDFRLQQGLIQVYQDWCEANPSCRNCPVIAHLNFDRAKEG